MKLMFDQFFNDMIETVQQKLTELPLEYWLIRINSPCLHENVPPSEKRWNQLDVENSWILDLGKSPSRLDRFCK